MLIDVLISKTTVLLSFQLKINTQNIVNNEDSTLLTKPV